MPRNEERQRWFTGEITLLMMTDWKFLDYFHWRKEDFAAT